MDLATDFASPQVLNIIRSAYESKGKQKGNQRSNARRRPTTNSKKKPNTDIVNRLSKIDLRSSLHTQASTTIKPVKLEVAMPQRGSLLAAERKLLSSNDQFKSIVYRPQTKWTDQPTTAELLTKKIKLRNAFTWKIDFPDYLPSILANAQAKLERINAQDSTAKTIV